MTEAKRTKTPKLTSSELKTRNELLEKMQRSGELDRLKTRLYAKLVLQEPWRHAMEDGARQAVQQSGGIAEVTMDELAAKLVSTGKANAPTSVEADMKEQIGDLYYQG